MEENTEIINDPYERINALFADKIASGAAPRREHFSLSGVHTKENSLKIDYVLNDGKGKLENHTQSVPVSAPDDIRFPLDNMRYIIAIMIHWDSFIDASAGDPKVSGHYHLMLERIRVNGASLGGKTNKGVTIKSTLTCPSGMVVAINSHFIRFDVDTYGFESELQEMYHTLENACYCYLYSDSPDQELNFDTIVESDDE